MRSDAMPTVTADLPGLVERALEETRRSIESFERIRSATRDPALRGLVGRFVEIEREEHEQLAVLLDSVRSLDGCRLQPLEQAGIPMLGEIGGGDLDESGGGAGVLLVALKRHARAAALYEALSARQTEPEVRDVLAALARAERRRSVELRAAYRRIA